MGSCSCPHRWRLSTCRISQDLWWITLLQLLTFDALYLGWYKTAEENLYNKAWCRNANKLGLGHQVLCGFQRRALCNALSDVSHGGSFSYDMTKDISWYNFFPLCQKGRINCTIVSLADGLNWLGGIYIDIPCSPLTYSRRLVCVCAWFHSLTAENK